jgi:hypothetical protein
MSSDWKQSSLDRRDFRHGAANDRKEKPTPKNTGRRKAKKSVILQYKTKPNMFSWSGTWGPWGKYRTREVAVEAWKKQIRKPWYSSCEWRIKGEKKTLTLETTE